MRTTAAMTLSDLRQACRDATANGGSVPVALLAAALDEIDLLHSEHRLSKWRSVKQSRERRLDKLTADQWQVFEAAEELAERAGWTWQQLAGNGKSQPLSRVRETVWTMLYDSGLSYPAIGELYGKHHTAILLACRRARPV